MNIPTLAQLRGTPEEALVARYDEMANSGQYHGGPDFVLNELHRRQQERLGRRLEGLTWALVGLTVVLVMLGVALLIVGCQASEGQQQPEPGLTYERAVADN